MGEYFPKLYVCFHNRWNPYDEQYNSIPPEYWMSMFIMMRFEYQTAWEALLRPLGEMVGQIANPDAFAVYWKYRQRETKMKGKLDDGQEYYHEDMNGVHGSAVANAHFDPTKGLVSSDGKIIIPKEKYQQMMGFDGIAISY